MRNFVITLAISAGLTACAGQPLMDGGAVGPSNARYEVARDRCSDGEKTLRQMTECNLAANRQFFVDIKFREMSMVDSYDARMRGLVTRYESGAENIDQFVTDGKRVWADLLDNVRVVSNADAAAGAQRQAAWMAMAAGLQNASVAMQRAQPAPSPTITCNSMALVPGQVTTTCH